MNQLLVEQEALVDSMRVESVESKDSFFRGSYSFLYLLIVGKTTDCNVVGKV